MKFKFGASVCEAHISRKIPALAEIAADFAAANFAGGGTDAFFKPLIVCDEHTEKIADAVCGGKELPRCVLHSGEAEKTWASAEKILRAAHSAGLGRDGVIIGVGGGVLSDLAAFAASIYMRGCRLALVSTTLLGMADAGIGGKTGFDLFGVKNLAGTFYPAGHVYMPLESLAGLPSGEWKSGFAELIKTAILDGDDFLSELESAAAGFPPGSFDSGFPAGFARAMLADGADILERCVSRSAAFKGKVVEADPTEAGVSLSGGGAAEKAYCRALLNLGHTFGHALEASAGLGSLSHGEAVAWGIARACELGAALGVTSSARAGRITALIASFGYEAAAPHPLMKSAESFLAAFSSDKKKKGGCVSCIVPDEKSARQVRLSASDMETVKQIAGLA